MIKVILIALTLTGLVGCAPCQPRVIKEPVEVRVPVPVPCQVEAPRKPKWQMDYPEVRNAGLFIKGNSALLELEQRRQYELELEAVLSACISPK